MENNNRSDIKKKTKDWLNKYGRYILLGIFVLSVAGVIACALTFGSSATPSGELFGTENTSAEGIYSHYDVTFDDDAIIRVTDDGIVGSVWGGIENPDNSSQWVDVESYWDTGGYGLFFTLPVSTPTAYVRPVEFFVATRELLFPYVDGAPIRFGNFGIDAVNFGDEPLDDPITVVMSTYVDYLDSNGEVISTYTDFVYDDFMTGEIWQGSYFMTSDHVEGSVIPSYCRVRSYLRFSSDNPEVTLRGCSIYQDGFYIAPTIVRVEQPIYTDYNVFGIVSDGINSLFDMEWLGGISFGLFFGLIIAIPVLFFVFKAFLGG